MAVSQDNSQENWDVVIPLIAQAINSSVHSTTKYTPYELVFGRKPNIISNLVVEEFSPQDHHLKLIRLELEKIRDDALSNQFDGQTLSKHYYNLKHREVTLEPEDLVLVKEQGRKLTKFGLRYTGPYNVILRKKDIYRLKHLENNKVIERHVSLLKPYKSRTEVPREETDELVEELT